VCVSILWLENHTRVQACSLGIETLPEEVAFWECLCIKSRPKCRLTLSGTYQRLWGRSCKSSQRRSQRTTTKQPVCSSKPTPSTATARNERVWRYLHSFTYNQPRPQNAREIHLGLEGDQSPLTLGVLGEGVSGLEIRCSSGALLVLRASDQSLTMKILCRILHSVTTNSCMILCVRSTSLASSASNKRQGP
jgi:hypothetical protein